MKRVILIAVLTCGSLTAQDRWWSFNIGGGPTFTTGDTSNRINTGYNFKAGAGYNFTNQIGIDIDYTFQGADLSNTSLAAAGAPGGFAHIWGFSADPIYRIGSERKLGGYVSAGYGVFVRTINLTRPGLVPATICDPWTLICYSGAAVANVIYRSNSTTKGGWNIGAGVTFRLTENAKFFTEIRYYDVLTSNVRTSLLPLTFGVRW